MARVCEPGFLMHAFEANNTKFSLLQLNVNNSVYGKNIAKYNCAIGECEKDVNFWNNPGHHGDHRLQQISSLAV